MMKRIAYDNKSHKRSRRIAIRQKAEIRAFFQDSSGADKSNGKPATKVSKHNLER